MKIKSSLVILFLFLANVIYSQNTEVFANKREISFDNRVEVRYEISVLADSIRLSYHKGLKVVGDPVVSSTVQVVNGVKTILKSWTYIFRPSDTGVVTIHAPVFYHNGEEIIGDEIKIRVSGDIDSVQLVNLKFDAFRSDAYKPDQTMRYVITDEFGYLEICENGKWIYLRRLTDAEMELIQKIK